MDIRSRAYLLVTCTLMSAVLVACDGRTPSSPTPGLPPTPSLSVTAIQPNSGAANAATAVRIVGTGFEPGAVVTVGAAATDVTVLNSTTITASVPTYPAGTVDVVVTNPGGQTGRLDKGFSYVTVTRATVTAISPNVGSTEGGTSLTISGTDFHPLATVSLGGVAAKPYLFQGFIFLTAPPHEEGVVDVVVTNPLADPYTLHGGYTYASPGTFDFNGTWDGDAGPEWEFPLHFTVEKNQVISVQCGGSDHVTFAQPVEVRNGAFAVSDGVGGMTGSIVAPSRARGTINVGACRDVLWYATKRSSSENR